MGAEGNSNLLWFCLDLPLVCNTNLGTIASAVVLNIEHVLEYYAISLKVSLLCLSTEQSCIPSLFFQTEIGLYSKGLKPGKKL